MSAEGDDGLPGKIVFFQKGEDCHGHGSPPVWIAEEDDVVFVHVFHMGGKLRTGILVLFAFGDIRSFRIGFGIGGDSFNFEHFRPG